MSNNFFVIDRVNKGKLLNNPPNAPCKKQTRRVTKLRSDEYFEVCDISTKLAETDLNVQDIHYENCGLIGRGDFSNVFKVRNMTDNRFYALKVDKRSFSKYNQGQSEVEILQKLTDSADSTSNNVCNFKGSFVFSNKLCQIYELYEHGNLRQFIDYQTRRLNKMQILQILIQILNGLLYIHSKNIIHCDIKPENILIHNDYSLKISDFGIATALDLNHNYSNNTSFNFDFEENVDSKSVKLISGEATYIAPELLQTFHQNFETSRDLLKIDIFSLGIILIELIYDIRLMPKDSLFAKLRDIDQCNHINWNWFHLQQQDVNDTNDMSDIQAMIEMMLQKDPKTRVSSKMLTIHLNNEFSDSLQQQSMKQFSKLLLTPKENQRLKEKHGDIRCIHSIYTHKQSTMISSDHFDLNTAYIFC